MMEEAVVENENTYALYQFWVFLLFMVFCWVGQAVAGVMGDAICFELLGKKIIRAYLSFNFALLQMINLTNMVNSDYLGLYPTEFFPLWLVI